MLKFASVLKDENTRYEILPFTPYYYNNTLVMDCTKNKDSTQSIISDQSEKFWSTPAFTTPFRLKFSAETQYKHGYEDHIKYRRIHAKTLPRT